jgi:hypothetical protein
MSRVISTSRRDAVAGSPLPTVVKSYPDVTNWTILGLVAGASAGWLALEIGLVFCFQLGWSIHGHAVKEVPNGMAIVIMRACLGMVFGMMAAGMLGVIHGLIQRRLMVRGVLAWVLIGMSAGILCWIIIEIIDRYVVYLEWTEPVVWAAVWGLIGCSIGAGTGAYWHRRRQDAI